MKRIAVDIDGVLADSLSAIIPVINNEYGFSLKKDDITSWNYEYNGIRIGDFLISKFSDSDFVLNMPLEPNSLLLNSIYHKYVIDAVTTRPEVCRDSTVSWLYRRDFTIRDVKFCEKKTTESTGCSVLIDDYSKNAIDFVESGGDVIFYTAQPYNKNVVFDSKYRDNIFKCNNWSDIISRLKIL